MLSGVEIDASKDDDVVEVTGESENATEKEDEVTQKVVPIPRPPPSFPQRLVKKTEESKYRRFISMLKQLSINLQLIEALEKMPGYAKFMKDMVTKKRAVSFEDDDDRLQHCSAIATSELQSVSAITYRVESISEVQVEERLGVEALAAVMMHLDSDGIEEYDKLVAERYKCEYRSKPKKFELDMKNHESLPA
uniref:Integrase core domain containing protein n=1 Tax=Solanum tuberosum TaxID=4113 RepID=M1DTH2_SOLTU